MTPPEWTRATYIVLGPGLAVAAGAAAAHTARNWATSPAEDHKPSSSWGDAAAWALIGLALSAASAACFREWWSLAAFSLGILFVYAAVLDARARLLPDLPTLVALVFGLAWRGVLDGLIGALMIGASIVVFRILATRFLKREALGLGDVKLCCAAGSLLDPASAWAAIGVGALATLATHYLGRGIRREQNDEIPFGPGLLAAIWAAWAACASQH